MGAWGIGPFDSDSAADWCRRFDDSDASDRSGLINGTFATAQRADALDIDTCAEIVAAATVVATLLHGGDALPLGPESLGEIADFEVTDDVRSAAISALGRVVDPDSEWSQLWAESDSLDEALAGIDRVVGLLLPYENWAPHRRLEDAAAAYLNDPAIALDALRGVVDFDAVRGFSMERVVSRNEWGDTLYQEIALTDGDRLILWMGDDAADEDRPGAQLFKSEVRVLDLASIPDVVLEVNFRPQSAGKSLYSAQVRVFIHDGELRFTKALDDGGPDQTRRLIEFGKLLTNRGTRP
jgi:hypothetical protein